MPAQCVMVVDDEPLIRWVVNEALGRFGYRVIEAESEAAAVAALSRSCPEVVLVDYRLPGSTDLSLVGTCRRLCPGSKCVLMTGALSSDVESRARRMGAAAVVAKPFDVTSLAILINDLLAQG